jgi:hypothetical protein
MMPNLKEVGIYFHKSESIFSTHVVAGADFFNARSEIVASFIYLFAIQFNLFKQSPNP